MHLNQRLCSIRTYWKLAIICMNFTWFLQPESQYLVTRSRNGTKIVVTCIRLITGDLFFALITNLCATYCLPPLNVPVCFMAHPLVLHRARNQVTFTNAHPVVYLIVCIIWSNVYWLSFSAKMYTSLTMFWPAVLLLVFAKWSPVYQPVYSRIEQPIRSMKLWYITVRHMNRISDTPTLNEWLMSWTGKLHLSIVVFSISSSGRLVGLSTFLFFYLNSYLFFIAAEILHSKKTPNSVCSCAALNEIRELL